MFSGRRIIVDAAKGRGSPALFFAGDHGKAGIWVTEERNVYEDRRALFGEDPPTIGAVSSDDRHGQHGRGGRGVLRGHLPRTGAVSPGGYRFFSFARSLPVPLDASSASLHRPLCGTPRIA